MVIKVFKSWENQMMCVQNEWWVSMRGKVKKSILFQGKWEEKGIK